MKVIHTSGSRKRAVARATLKPGKGIVRFNSLNLTQVHNALVKEKIEEPLFIAGDIAKKVNISVKTQGGGIIGQAEAARSAIAKALSEFDKSLAKTYMDYDRTLLVQDVRLKETHKPNRHGKARAKVQKSYR
jgi:small subunit ribosomal protein S9